MPAMMGHLNAVHKIFNLLRDVDTAWITLFSDTEVSTIKEPTSSTSWDSVCSISFRPKAWRLNALKRGTQGPVRKVKCGK